MKLTQNEFDKLLREYEELARASKCLTYDNPAIEILENEMGKLEEKISSARDTSKNGMIFAKMDDYGTITLINAVMYENDDVSPDGISYYYDIWEITPESAEMPFMGGCYWGYINVESMLKEEGYDIDSMINVSDNDEISDMIADESFNYERIVEIMKGE